MHGTDARRRVVLLLLALLLPACGSGPATDPSPTPEPLGPIPVLLSPVNNEQATSDTPTFTVRNAQGFDRGQANYTFRVTTASGQREIASATVPAGSNPDEPHLRDRAAPGHEPLPGRWSPASATAEVALPDSHLPHGGGGLRRGRRAPTPSRWSTGSCPPATSCRTSTTTRGTCSARRMAAASGPNNFFGFLSLGDEGHVTVDMEACAVDLAGPDVRVYQFVAQGAGHPLRRGQPDGPLPASRAIACPAARGSPAAPASAATATSTSARRRSRRPATSRSRTGSSSLCPGGTPSEGADIDAVEILHLK